MDVPTVIPRSIDLVPQVIIALRELGGTATSKDIDQRVITNLRLPKNMIDQPRRPGKDNRSEIKYKLAWSRTLAKRAGLIALAGASTWTLHNT